MAQNAHRLQASSRNFERALSTSPILDVAERLLRVAVTIASADQSPSHRDNKELQQLYAACSSKVNALIKAMRGADGGVFGLAEDAARAARLQEIEQALEVTAEDRAARGEVERRYREAIAPPSGHSSKVVPELAFIAKYLDARRSFLPDTAFTGNLWHLFAAQLDSAFQESARQERIEKVARVVQGVCNIVAKEYLVKRHNLSAGGGLLLQVTSKQFDTIETSGAPREEKRRGFSWLRRSAGDAQDKNDAVAVPAAEAPPVHQGLSFEDLRIRVESIGQAVFDELPSLGFQQQISQLHVLMTGKPEAAQLAKLVRQVSPYTHPDLREQHFPEKALHGALDSIFKGITTLAAIAESSDTYEEDGAMEALLQLLHGFSDFKKKEQVLARERQERGAEDQRRAFEALPKILQVLEALQQDVAEIKATLGKRRTVSEDDLDSGSDK